MKNVEKYPHILENWLKHYISSMNDTGNLIPGDNTGEAPFGVKIIFDGYAEMFECRVNFELGAFNTTLSEKLTSQAKG